MRGRLYWSCGTALVLFSLALFLFNTYQGIGVLPDSTRYMGLDQNPYDAPLYAWMLQGLAATGLGMALAAKLLGIVFVCANTALVWHILVRATGRYGYALAGTALLVISPQFVMLHSTAMSEPLFILMLLSTLLALLCYLETEKRTWLVVSAVALGLAALTRFTAPPLGAAIAIALLLNRRHGFKRRLEDVILFGFVSAVIFMGWVLLSQLTAGQSIGRELAFHGNMGLRQWLRSLEALTAWLLPDDVPFALRIVVLTGFLGTLAVLTVAQVRETLRRKAGAKVIDALLPLILGLFFFFYLGFMVLSTSIEANLSLNGRYAFPIFVMTLLLATIVLAHFSKSSGIWKLLHHGLVALAVVVAASSLLRTSVRSYAAYESGIGYASVLWSNSPTLEAVKKLPAEAVIYSNGADVIAFRLERPVFYIPKYVDLRTGEKDPNKPFEVQVEELRAGLTAGTAYVVFFDAVNWRFYLATEDDLKQRLFLNELVSEKDGRIYGKTLPGN
ncbi:glycosyltransferase family 39 protein [Sinorhizobium sp. BG8]|uniref:ArnT family glycosyltransferase n=1 Tax=Sinorhizobium sp. BG8 TaxID=2613773 RepID=UPI00193DAECF|nr:glycosyltransferase family 39 protein [Sinorhizobium sp. BG8]